MKIPQTFRAKPEVVKAAKVLAKLDLNRPLSRWYEIAVEEKIDRDKSKKQRLAKAMNNDKLIKNLKP